ncbi:MAG: fluoride efflux transporter CrcB [Bacteroidia bacterium]
MKLILAIGTGSFIGGISRYLLSQFIQTKFLSTFPFGTLGVNIIGCFLIGVVFAISERGNMTQEWRLFLATGVLGGFTTFSAFSNETVGLLRDGQFWYASIYIVSSILLGLLATLTGITIIKFL